MGLADVRFPYIYIYTFGCVCLLVHWTGGLHCLCEKHFRSHVSCSLADHFQACIYIEILEPNPVYTTTSTRKQSNIQTQLFWRPFSKCGSEGVSGFGIEGPFRFVDVMCPIQCIVNNNYKRDGESDRAIYCAELRSFRRGCMALRSREDNV